MFNSHSITHFYTILNKKLKIINGFQKHLSGSALKEIYRNI